MVEDDLAADMLTSAIRDEQASRRIGGGIDIDIVRTLVRHRARAQHVKVRTAQLNGNVLAVVLADASIWHESTQVMRAKLVPAE